MARSRSITKVVRTRHSRDLCLLIHPEGRFQAGRGYVMAVEDRGVLEPERSGWDSGG